MAEKPKSPSPRNARIDPPREHRQPGPQASARGARTRARAEAPPPSRAGTIALLGRPNVGKSTLLNALLGEPIAIVSHHPQTTRDRIAGVVTRDHVQFVFLDTPGFHHARTKLGERMNDVASAAASDCDVAVFMTDVDIREGQAPRVRDEDRTILATIPEKKPTILLLNKIDRVTPRALLFPVLEAYGALRDFAAIVPISALKADGTQRILDEIAKHLPEGDHLYGEDELSDKPVRFFIAEFMREQILRRTREEVPHGVAVAVETFEEGKDIVRIGVTVHVAKDSHKGIIIGDGGKMLTAIGTSARKRAEQMLGTRVHLQTFIRTTPGWFDDPGQLRDLGYSDGSEARAKRRAKKKSGGPKGAPKTKAPSSSKAASSKAGGKTTSTKTGSSARGHA